MLGRSGAVKDNTGHQGSPNLPMSDTTDTPRHDYRVAARRLLRGLLRRGLDPAPVLAEAGIAPDLLHNEGVVVRGMQLIQLMAAVNRALDDEFLGLTARRSKPGSLQLLVEMGLQCDTLAAALEQIVRVDHLLTDDRLIELRFEGDDVALQFAQSDPALDPDNFLPDHWLLHWHRLLSWMTGLLIPLKRVELTVDEAPSPARLSFFLCGDWHPAQAVAAFVFSRKYLTLPIVRTRSEWQRYLERGAQGEAPEWPQGETRWSERVRGLLKAELLGERRCLAFEEVAARLGVSDRTLRRLLGVEGAAFTPLRDAIRRDIAIEKLHFQHLAVSDVADQLGFAEPRSFSRAFKRWTGKSPNAYQGRR
jgi:AraC-like DNA-binding protein